MEDEQIIALLNRRDETALAAAEQRFGRCAYALATAVLHDPRDAAECISDALLALWQRIPPEEPQHLQAYFLKIVRNIALKRLRGRLAQKRQADVLLPLAELAEALPGEDVLAEEVEKRRLLGLIEDFLRGESAANRALFVCRYWYLDDLNALAARFAISRQAAESRLFRMRGRLKRFLQQEGIDV